jgi:hypothetical protein
MWLIIGGGTETRRVEGGKRIQMRCSHCHQSATFYECRVKKSVSAFFFLELWDKTTKAMQCGECLTAFQESEAEAPIETSAERAARTAKEMRRAAEEQQQKLDALAEEGRRAAHAKKQKDKDLDKALAELKKKMGK